MNNYELLFILPGTLTEEEAAPLVDKVRKIIEENGGEKIEIQELGKSRLAYPVKHIRYGYFNLAHFQVEAAKLAVIQKKLALIPELLRVLLQKYDSSKKLSTINQAGKAVLTTLSEIEHDRERPKKEKRVEVRKEKAEVQEKPPAASPAREEKKAKPAKKVDLEEIDKKLDEILDIDLNNV